MARVRLERLTKRFGRVVAAREVSLDIGDGEFFSFLGPSGCGKTTTLRMVAGFKRPDAGRVYFDDADVTDLPPEVRPVGMVFQNYALFPNMTVFGNVAFPLPPGRGHQAAGGRASRLLALFGMTLARRR